MKAKDIIKRLFWIDAKVNNKENIGYQKTLQTKYGLKVETYEKAENGIEALEQIQFESIFVITSGTIYPEFFKYMKRTFKELRVIPFSIIFTSSSKNFINKHKFDEIGKLYNKTFYNRGGVTDYFNGVIAFIEEIYKNLDSFQTCDKYKGIFTKNYSGLIVFEEVIGKLPLPSFYEVIYNNRDIDYIELNNFTKFFLQNFCSNKEVEKLLKPLILFKEVPEEIISKYWARVYTYETPFYSIMNKALMRKEYKEYEVYIKLLYKGLSLNSYRPKFENNLTRGTKLEISEINYLKSIAGRGQIIFNRSFLSFSLNIKKSIEFQSNTTRFSGFSMRPEIPEIMQSQKTETGCIIANPPKKGETKSLSVLIEVTNIKEKERENYMISNALLYDISYYTKEEEVLIFPFTGFEVIDWESTNSFYDKDGHQVEGTHFKFKFSKKYFKKIKEEYD